MSQLSQNLQKNEEVIQEAKVHWATLIIPIIISIFTFGIGLVWLIPSFLRFISTELSLSNKRLVGKYGLINTHQMDSPLNKINSVSVEQSIVGKLFGYGTININTASTIYNFKCIKNAEVFKHDILNQIEKYQETKSIEQAQNIANAMKTN